MKTLRLRTCNSLIYKYGHLSTSTSSVQPGLARLRPAFRCSIRPTLVCAVLDYKAKHCRAFRLVLDNLTCIVALETTSNDEKLISSFIHRLPRRRLSRNDQKEV